MHGNFHALHALVAVTWAAVRYESIIYTLIIWNWSEFVTRILFIFVILYGLKISMKFGEKLHLVIYYWIQGMPCGAESISCKSFSGLEDTRDDVVSVLGLLDKPCSMEYWMLHLQGYFFSTKLFPYNMLSNL